MSALNIESMSNGNHGIYNPGSPDQVTVDRTEITFPKQGGTQSFTISTFAPFTVTVENGDFITLEVLPGNIVLHATAYDSTSLTDTREATVKVTLDGESDPVVTVAVKQTALPSMNFSVSPMVITLPATEATSEIELFTASGIDWRVSNISEWLTLSSYTGLVSDVLTLTATDNTEPQVRTGEVIFKSGLSTFTIKVQQDKATE